MSTYHRPRRKHKHRHTGKPDDTPPTSHNADTHHPRPPRLRRGVGLVVINTEGLVLAGLRNHASGNPAWQLPQGGIDRQERLLAAAYRELEEETGLTPMQVQFVNLMPTWTTYMLPPEFANKSRIKGQRHRWFLFRYLAEGVPDIAQAKHVEFKQLQWMPAADLQAQTISFRQDVYAEVFKYFAKHLKK